jgi:hypothetical protein
MIKKHTIRFVFFLQFPYIPPDWSNKGPKQPDLPTLDLPTAQESLREYTQGKTVAGLPPDENHPRV